MTDRLPHWQMMERFDPDLLDKIEPWREQLLLSSDVLTVREKELVMSAMCAVIRFLPGFTIHAERALAAGATVEELFATCELTLLIGGVPAYRESSLLLKELIDGREASGDRS